MRPELNQDFEVKIPWAEVRRLKAVDRLFHMMQKSGRAFTIEGEQIRCGTNMVSMPIDMDDEDWFDYAMLFLLGVDAPKAA